MRNSIDRVLLLNALGIARKVVSGRGPSEILKNVLISEGKIETQGDGIRVKVPVDYAGPSVLLPLEKLETITSATRGDLLFSAEGKAVKLSTVNGSAWELPTADVNEWPAHELAARAAVATIPAEQLGRALRTVLAAVGRSESNSALGGVLIELKEGVVNCVATDGRRMHLAKFEIEQATDDCEILLPANAAALVMGIANKAGEEKVQIDRANNCAVIEIGEPPIEIYAQMLTGKFPKWRGVVEKTEEQITTAPAVVRADRLRDGMKQAAICTSETSLAVACKFSDAVVIRSKSAENGKSRVTVEAQQAGGEEIVKLNPQFCADFLRTVDGMEPVKVYVKDNESAVILESEDARAVIMPVGGVV